MRCIILLLSACLAYGGVINLKHEDIRNLGFKLQLPNNDTVDVELFFKLLRVRGDNIPTEGEGAVAADENSTTTEAIIVTTVEDDIMQSDFETRLQNPISVDEVIEAFRQDLITKELDISGIIQSDHAFYRHFKFDFVDGRSLKIRCTYESDFKERSLDISCYEYREFDTERILSNGEAEIFKRHDPNHKPTIRVIDWRNMQQTYNMRISK